MSEKLTDEQRAFRDMLAALFRFVAMVFVFIAGAIYHSSELRESAFYSICVALFFIILDNNFRHQLTIDKEKL